MKTKEYCYTNKIGRLKRLEVRTEKTKEGKYWYVIWDVMTGECCGGGENTAEELASFLSYYGLKFIEA